MKRTRSSSAAHHRGVPVRCRTGLTPLAEAFQLPEAASAHAAHIAAIEHARDDIRIAPRRAHRRAERARTTRCT